MVGTNSITVICKLNPNSIRMLQSNTAKKATRRVVYA